MRILLVGYYGWSNLGDDILMQVTFRLVRAQFPEADIAVQCVEGRGDYVPAFLGGGVRVVRPGEERQFDLIVHGGGGVFFDYTPHGLVDRLRNAIIGALGWSRWMSLERGIRSLLGKPLLQATHRLGWGIGVGSFTRGSPRLRASAAVLADFDDLVVRDDESLHNLAALPFDTRAHRGSDLAFFGEHWVPEDLPEPEKNGRRLGIVLRDWSKTDAAGYPADLKAWLDGFAPDYDVTVFVLGPTEDPQLLDKLAGVDNVSVWRAGEVSLADYTGHLAAQDIVLSSRAHGVICAALLGVPALIIDLEPKLHTVHAMLKDSTRLLDQGTWDVGVLKEELAAVAATNAETRRQECADNRQQIESAVAASLALVKGQP